MAANRDGAEGWAVYSRNKGGLEMFTADQLVAHADERSPTGFAIYTLENTTIKHEVTPGDWIITGTHGEYYPCKPHIFAEFYEPV